MPKNSGCNRYGRKRAVSTVGLGAAPRSFQVIDILGITASSHQHQKAGHLDSAAIRRPNRR